MASNKELTQSNESLQAEIAALKAQLAAKPVKGSGELIPKVSLKGAVSVYGLGRFPVTLYAQQWDRLFKSTAKIIAFMDANKANLSMKDKPVNHAVPVVPAEPVPVHTSDFMTSFPPVDATDAEIEAALQEDIELLGAESTE